MDVSPEVVDLGIRLSESLARNTATALDDAREQFTTALARDRADRGLAVATEAAHAAVQGLATDGPVRFVNAERARLTEQIEYADREAKKWERAVLSALARQRNTHRDEQTVQHKAVSAAYAHAREVRAEVAAPLIEQATADGIAYLTTRDRMWEATAARSTAGRLRKRAGQRAATEAVGEHRATEDTVRRHWGGLPTGVTGVRAWAEAVAGKRADIDPRVTEARRDAEQTNREQRTLAQRHLYESGALRQQVFGSATPSTAITRATQWRTRAEQARSDLAEIETLPVIEAAQLIHDLTARAEAERVAAERAQAARDARAAQFGSPSTDHDRTGPERDVPRL